LLPIFFPITSLVAIIMLFRACHIFYLTQLYNFCA
jgi:hypothetical protein